MDNEVKINWCADNRLLDGKHAYPTDCKKYINCTSNDTKVFQCPKGSSYHRQQKQCESEEFVDCSDRISNTYTGSQNNGQVSTYCTIVKRAICLEIYEADIVLVQCPDGHFMLLLTTIEIRI